MAVQPDLDRLKSKLNNSTIRQSDLPLYEVISTLIAFLKQSQTATNETINSSITIGIAALEAQINALKTLDYLTHSNESSSLANSRELKAGTNITFDDTVANERTINASGGGISADYVVVSDGSTVTPVPIHDGAGNFIYVPYTP